MKYIKCEETKEICLQLENSPNTVEEMAVVVSKDKKLISFEVVQHLVTILEIVEDTQDGTVVIVWG